MMRLQAVLVLWAVVSSFGRSLVKPRPGRSCVTTCTGINQLNYQKGFRYTYKYTTAANTFLQGSSHESSGLAIECLVNIDVLDKCHHILKLRNAQIKGSMSNEEELLPGQGKLRASLEKHPLQFSFQDGIIPEICPSDNEETWVLNIKRGILSVLQDSYAVNKQKTVEEVDISGKCLSTYKVEGSLLVKSKDLNRCSLRTMAVTSLQSVVLPDAASHQQILDSQLECMQSYKGGVVEMATCNESNIFRPFSKDGKGAKTEIFTTLKLLKMEEVLSMPRVELKPFRLSTLLFEREHGQRKKTGYLGAERVAEAVRQLCITKGMTLESADLFMSLVFDLRSLSIGALRDLWQRALFKCRDNWQPLVDTLPACGTEACISFLTEIILSKELDKDRADTFLWSLAFIPEPTAPMITAVTALMKSPEAGIQTFLGASSLVHNFCSKNNRCQVIPEVQEFMKILESYVEGNCRARESEKKEKVLMSLKAIGNAGLAASAQIPTLNRCLQSKSNLLEVRLAAIYAFRRLPCEADRTVLVQLYQTVDEDVELRIASYYLLMKCPSDQLFETVGLTLRNERSSQVGSFVWTHLSQLMESNDPLKQQMKETLPNYIVSKDFDLEHWKYSSYMDATFQSESSFVGANTEATLVFSPKSFLPRSAMANLTIYVMGYALNLLEVGIRVENAEYLVQKIFGHKQAPFMDSPMKNSGKKWRMRNPLKSSLRSVDKKGVIRRHAVGKFAALKQQVEKPRPRKAKQSCQNVNYNRIYEIEAKFAKRMAKKKKKLTCGLSMKIFGNELSFLDCSDVKTQIKQYSLDMAEIAIRLLKGQEVQFNRRTSLATEELTFSSISGLPIRLAVNASAATNIKIKGNVDLKQRTDFIISGFIKPSAHIHVSVHMGVEGTLGKAGLEWVAGMRTLTSLDGGIQLKKGQDLKIFLNTPQETMEIIDISSRLYTTNPGRKEEIIGSHDRKEARTCSEEEFSRQIGWQICSEMSYPSGTSGPAFPLSGPAEASVMLIKRDKGLQQYLLEAAYSYVIQKNTWFPAEAVLHFFMGTPQSDINRDVAIDFQLNYSKRKLLAKIIHPKKKIKIEGEITKMKHSCTGLLDVLIDDKDLYYVKGWTNLQSLDGEQMFFSQLEAKFTKHGSPIILSGNVTRVPGQKIAFFVSLNNVMQETATVSVRLVQKVDEKQKQYTIEADTYLPRIMGCQIIGFLQQRGTTWSSTLRGKYGLFGKMTTENGSVGQVTWQVLNSDALNLRHECNMAQKIKREASPTETYKLQVQHEFHCTQITSYNHKLHLQHEENALRTHTELEINYGKHWDEINNRKKIFITQLFKNDSSLSLTNYFLEFTLQIPEKNINYRTQLQHSHLLQGYAESNTHAKVHYNDKIPFQAGIQWKDTSKPNLKKWEGSLKLDTPWLYLQTSHKLNQPHVRAYQSSVEITAAKAISVTNLMIYTYYKNKGNKREGRIHIHTPSTTYLKASTVGYMTGSLFRSHSEVVSLWNLPVKNKILVENKEKLKSFWFWLKHQKKEFNFTANCMSRDEPKKKRSMSVVALWTDNKSPPLVMQLNGQIEELKREKMLFQNRASIRIRHPFKLPVPQNILLQETFTVDKRKKHYVLEVKALVNEKDETIHTLILGYQPEKPYICVSLAHPYNGEVIPKNMEVCVRTKTDHIAKFEAEAIVKINKRDAFKFHGQYQNKSTDTDCWYLVHFDTDHSLQLRVPHTLILDGELFTMQNKNEDFNYGANCQFTINKLDTSQFSVQVNGSSNQMSVYSQFSHPYQSTVPYTFQAYATAKNYGESNYNGTFYLHSNGKDLMVSEFDVVNESKRNVRILGIKAALHQSLLTGPENSQFQITGKAYNSRYLLVSSLQLDKKAFDVDVMGLKEYREGLIISLTGTVQHNMNNGHMVPQFLHVTATLKQQNNTNEGNLNIEIDDILYRLHLQNNNTFCDSTAHDLIVTLTQNGSLTIPAMTEFKGQLELGPESRLGQACWQTNDKSICFQLLQVTKTNQTKVTGKVTHNLEELITTGLPADGRLSLNYDHVNNNRAVLIEMQSGSKRIQASVEMERTFTGTPIYQLTTSLLHSVEELETLGLPFSSTGSYHYQNLRNGYIANVSVSLEKQQLRAEIEQKSTARTGEIFLSFNHDIKALSKRIPATIQVNCSGEASQKLLLGHCSGTVADKPVEVQISLTKQHHRYCSILELRYRKQGLSFEGCLNLMHRQEIRARLLHTSKLLQSLGFPSNAQVMTFYKNNASKHVAVFHLTADGHQILTDGELSMVPDVGWYWVGSFFKPGHNAPSNSVEIRGLVRPKGCDLTGSLKASSKNMFIMMNVTTKCYYKIGSYVAEIKWKYKVRSMRSKKEKKFSFRAAGEAKGNLYAGSFVVQNNENYFNTSGKLLASKNKVILTWTVKQKMRRLKSLAIPESIQTESLAYFISNSIGTAANIIFDVKPVELKLKAVWGRRSRLDLFLRHAVPTWRKMGIPSRSKWIATATFGNDMDIRLEATAGPCRVAANGQLSRGTFTKWNLAVDNQCPYFESAVPARFSLNGTMRTDCCEADFTGQLQMDNKFAQLEWQTIWTPIPSIDFGFRHSVPLLLTVGIPKDNRLLIRTGNGMKHEASVEFTIGKCSFRAVGDVKVPGNRKEGLRTDWSASLLNRCLTLERVGVPQNLETSGSLKINICKIAIKANMLSDGKAAEFHLETSCDPKYTVQGVFKHTIPQLSNRGLPSESRIFLSAAKAVKTEGSFLLQSGNCKVRADGNLNPGAKAEWMWVTETDCQVLQNFKIPAQSQCNGSIQIEGCKAELLTSVELEGNSAYLELNSECDPKVNIEVIFEHKLPVLEGIPAHNKLFFTAERHLKSEFEMDLKLGTCNLLASGGLQVKNKTELNFLIKNKCKKLQDLGAPLKIDGSGYIAMNGVSFGSQIQINVDQAKLEGLLTLQAGANKHAINASLFHNIDGASRLGIPENAVVALTAEKQGDVYKRSIRFIVDSKQIVEDLTFVHKAHHISLNYKLTHNIEILKTLFIDDHIDIQVNASIQGLTPNLDGSVRIIVDGEKSIAYAFNTYLNDDHLKLIIRNNHNSESLATAGYPKEIVLVLTAQRTGTKMSSVFDIQYDAKNMKLSMDASKQFALGTIIEINVEFKHTIPFIKQLGVPFSIKADCYGMLKDTDIDVSLKLNYDPLANLILHVEGRNQYHSKELQLTVLQNIPALSYLPGAIEIAPKVNYTANMIKGMLNIILDKNKLNAFTILTAGDSGYSEVLEMTHTFTQLKTIPKKLVCNTVYQKTGRTYMLSHNAAWEDKEINFSGNYSGPFPKIFGRHETHVDFLHPFTIPLPQKSQVRMSLSHSLLSHQDDIVINWDNMDQVVLLASLNLADDRLESRANLQHPFKLALEKFELKCLSERKEQKYNQKAHVAWNGGQPVDLKFTLEYKLESNLTAWETCLDFSSGQLQPLLLIQSLHGCGSAKHTQNSFTESVELHWGDKKINQSFEYQNNRPVKPDNIWIAATFSNIFQSSCGRQDILGRIQTDYHDQLNHYLKVALCNMSNSIKWSGKHQRNKGEVVLSSQTRVSLSSDEKHDMLLGMSLRNDGQADIKNYSLDMEWKASEASHLGLLGTYTASALMRSVVLEGKIDHREKIKLATTHEKGCQQYYTGYTHDGSNEDGVKLAFCSNGRGSAKAQLYHMLNQTRKGELGHIMVTVVNKSMQSVLRVTAQGCGHLITRTEAKLSEIVLQFKNQLLKKLKDFDLRVWKFRKNVEDTDFLYETCGWMLKVSQKTADVIKNGGRTFRQLWKLSRVRQMMLHVVPLYLAKIQETLQQLQGELQKPVATLKDAYYDVTLKKLDQEWKQKTEEYLEKIQSFIPTVVQDTWLLQSVPRVLQITKQAFDLATQQVLKWAEAKISKATSKIHKPLANLYKYAPEDCSVVVNVPLLPVEEQLLDVANITNYLVETKLIKALRSLYNINPVAEYYRLKRRMMDSPFEHQALFIGNKHYVTFDGKMYDFASKCSFLLAKDFQRNTFTVLLNHESNGRNSLRVEMNHTIIDIYPGVKVEENCKASELPLVKNGVTVRRNLNEVKVSNQNGVTVSCDMQHEFCSLTLPGWYHGLSAGLFGTNDNEAGNEFTLPNHSQTENVQEFAQKWQIDAPCRTTGKKVKLCFGSAFQYICKALFKGTYSPLRNCFRVVDPVPFYDMCLNDMCESSDLQPGCNLAAAFVHLCNRNFVPLEIPSQCVAGKDSDNMQNDDVIDNEQWLTLKPADVLFIIEERDCNKPIVTKLPSLINSLVETFKKQGVTDVKFGFIGFGDDGVHEQHLLVVKSDNSTSSSWHLEKELGNLMFTRNVSHYVPAGVKLVTQWPFRTEATKTAILLTCSRCYQNYKLSEDTLQNLLTSSGIILHVLKEMRFQLKDGESDASVVGLDNSDLFRVSTIGYSGNRPFKTLRHHIVLPDEDMCLAAAIKSRGAIFDSSKLINQSEHFLQLFSCRVTRMYNAGKYEICRSTTG